MKNRHIKEFFAILILGFLLVSGCTNTESTKNANKFDQVESYVHSANSRLSFLSSVDINTVWVGNIKANASAAKSDLSEALKILNTIPPGDLNSQDQIDLQALIVMANVDIEYCDLLQGSYSDYIENIQTYNQTRNPDVAANSMKGIKMSLSNMKSSYDHMTEEMNSIKETDLSPQEVRPDFISMKSKIQYSRDSISKTSNTLENECNIKCNSGYVVGTDCQCHPACGASYCSANAVCCGGQCYKQCPFGSVMSADCQCYPSCGTNYCSGNTICCGGQCFTQCPYGSVMGSDCQCHPACGTNYCSGNTVCCGGQCNIPCPLGSVMGTDCQCHPACGTNYCSANAVCCGGECYTPCQSESGSLMGPSLVMGADCQCHLACGSNYCSGNTVCCRGQCYGPCLSGARGTDCQCHPVCGSGYCSANAVCCGGQCYTPCPLGSVMGNDCMCHAI